MASNTYEYLIVGAGLFGCVFAHEMTKLGFKCLVIDKRSHLGGNVYCANCQGINIHQYGAHIFHTNDREIWNYVNRFVRFNNYVHSPLAIYRNELYNLPFNMHTFHQLWKTKTPREAMNKVEQQKKGRDAAIPANLEEQAISLVGWEIYEKLIKGYTEKQWGRKATDLPASVIKRLPLRFTYNNNYFNDKYQGIPAGGYNKLIDGLLEGVEVRLNTDYHRYKYELDQLAANIVYTGSIDEFYHFRFGVLEYRSLSFQHSVYSCANYQGAAVINYTDPNIPFTRSIEHKHFEYTDVPLTVVTREYSTEWKPGLERYYPINDEKNQLMLARYKKMADHESNVIFGGRLAEYRYYDMHQVIASALKKASQVRCYA